MKDFGFAWAQPLGEKDGNVLDGKLRDALLDCTTPRLADARASLKLPASHLDSGIRPVVPFSKMVGMAVTARIEVASNESAADLTPLVEAYQTAATSSASIIVLQVPRELHHYGIFGEQSATLARAHGFVGAVVDGAARDSHALRAMEFPVFCRVIAPGYIVDKASAVAVGEPVVVGGRTIHCGDVLVADNDGIVVLRPQELLDVLARAQAVQQWEDRITSLMASGKTLREAEGTVGPPP